MLAAVAATGCTPKNVAYFQDVDEAVIAQTALQQITIKPEDRLAITVNTKEPELTALFNLPYTPKYLGARQQPKGSGQFSTGLSTEQGVSTYAVDKNGNIDFPVLGELHVAGMTRSEVAGYIKGELIGRGLVKKPIVMVDLVNAAISVVGEVRSPGRYAISNDHLTVVDALALAGDLDIQGRRDNVLVLREVGGKRQAYRLDLTKGLETLNSPGYYLQQNDVVYVEPNGVRKRQTSNNGNVVLSASFWVSVASLLTSVAVLIFK